MPCGSLSTSLNIAILCGTFLFYLLNVCTISLGEETDKPHGQFQNSDLDTTKQELALGYVYENSYEIHKISASMVS